MSLRLGALHDALLDPGNAEKAQLAAEEVASYERAYSDLKADLRIVHWMLGVVLLLLVGLFWQGFTIMGRLP